MSGRRLAHCSGYLSRVAYQGKRQPNTRTKTSVNCKSPLNPRPPSRRRRSPKSLSQFAEVTLAFVALSYRSASAPRSRHLSGPTSDVKAGRFILRARLTLVHGRSSGFGYCIRGIEADG